MLLKFTTTDMFNTLLIDVCSGKRVFEIATVSVPKPPRNESLSSAPLSSSETAATSEDFSPIKEYRSIPEREQQDISYRQTEVRDASGRLVADVQWEGRHPNITIDGRNVGGLSDLFGTSSVRFMPKVLAIPTKYDPDYVWIATENSLTLVDYSTDQVKGTFYQNALRFPLKSSKSRLSLEPQSPLSPDSISPPPSPKSPFKPSSCIFSSSPLSPPPSFITENPHKEPPRSRFVPTHVPGFGSNYLEFTTHPLTKDVEIILSFLIMEILRRGRFNLTPYTFDNPTIWQLKEARDIVLRRIRRNTV